MQHYAALSRMVMNHHLLGPMADVGHLAAVPVATARETPKDPPPHMMEIDSII